MAADACFGQELRCVDDGTERFATALDCADISFIPDGILDELPLPSRIGATRTGGIDLNKPRIRAALAAGLELAPAPHGARAASSATVSSTYLQAVVVPTPNPAAS